jgi:methyl-accepting chemotaxis protein
MIRLPILKDELAFLEKLLPDLETRPDLGQVANDIKMRIEKIREDIRALQENAGKNSK